MSARFVYTRKRLAVFIIAVTLFAVFWGPLVVFRTPETQMYDLQHPDVAIKLDAEGVQTITLDGERFVIPKEQAPLHPVAKEAWKRIMSRSRPSGGKVQVRPVRIFVVGVPTLVCLFYLAFRKKELPSG